MPDLHYEHPRLASVYDLRCTATEDDNFYLSLAHSPTPLSILDIGCGTGELTHAYAAQGHHVTGVDPAAAMLDVARTTPSSITWIQSDAQSLRLNRRFDLIVLTGHAFQVFLTPQDVRALFRTVHHHLKPSGTCAFESRNPAIDWSTRWNHTHTFELTLGTVSIERRVHTCSNTEIQFATRYHFDDETLTSNSTLRFWTTDELQRLLLDEDLRVHSLFGDWDRSPYNPHTSLEQIVLAQPNSPQPAA